MPQSALERLAFPGVVALISFLAYGSQFLFPNLEPHPLKQKQTLIFNVLVACIWITYVRACFTNPGSVPSNRPTIAAASEGGGLSKQKQRWCRKCETYKPPRAHHCKVCQRCIPKMDHHCPWTINCVSHRTFPHFFRFLCYSVASMFYLEYLLFIRAAVVWSDRNLPIYLGPTPAQMVFLFIFLIVNSVTFFALGILLARNIWCLGGNVTTIEGWEIERHETLVRRARARGGYLDGPDGMRIRIRKQEFPYDIGIYQNIRQGMGGTPLLWLWPFAATPSNKSGLKFDINGFEDVSLSWPPPDPDRMQKFQSRPDENPFTREEELAPDQERVSAFRQRQWEDLKRLERRHFSRKRGLPLGRRYRDSDQHDESLDCDYDYKLPNSRTSDEGAEGWRDLDGDRLDDFGIDKGVEFYDRDDVPLAEMLRRRRQGQADSRNDPQI